MITLKSSAYTRKGYADLFTCLESALDTAENIDAEPYVITDLYEVICYLDRIISSTDVLKKENVQNSIEKALKEQIEKLFKE